MSRLPTNAAGVHAGADALFKELGEGDLPPFTNPRLDWVATNSVEPLVKSLTFLPWLKIDETSGRYDAALPRSVLAEAVTAKAFLPPTPEGVAAFDKGNPLTFRPKVGVLSTLTKVLTKLGAFEKTFQEPKSFMAHAQGLSPSAEDRSQLEVSFLDFEERQPFDGAAPQLASTSAAPDRRTRSGADGQAGATAIASAPPTPGPAALRWLTKTKMSALLGQGDSPFRTLMRLGTLMADKDCGALLRPVSRARRRKV